MEIVDTLPGDPRLASEVLPVLNQLREQLTAESFAEVYEEGYPQGLRFTAAYDKGRCVGVAGWRLVACTSALRKLYIDDLVTAATDRSQGVGTELLAHLLERARRSGCTVLDLDSGVQRSGAHRFYMRERLAVTAFHFSRAVPR
jgi:GNAT superfamily N-acetyltransferase